MVMVSVIVAVYNHEKYIRQAIDSILMQKTTFEIEVLIGEDCSTDSSRLILKELEKKCPEYFHFFYREKNYGAEKNFKDLYRRMKGKYFIVLEGDDYWTYNYKLQKQVDYLEKHEDYIECSHRVSIVDKDSNAIDIEYPDCKKEEYSIHDFMSGILPGQTATNMYRNYYKTNIIDYSLESVPFIAGDKRKAFIVVSQGRVHCIQEKWSCYRYVTDEGSSFSAKHLHNRNIVNQALKFYCEMMRFSKKIKNDDALLASEQLYFMLLLSQVKREKSFFPVKMFLKEFSGCKHKLKILGFAIRKEFGCV